MSIREKKLIIFDSTEDYLKWKQKCYRNQDGVKEVGCYWGDDGKIYTYYIELY